MNASDGAALASAASTKPSEAAGRQSLAGTFGGLNISSPVELPDGGGKLPVSEYFPWDDPEFERDPYPWFARAQREVPVVYDDGGYFVVTRYQDIVDFGNHPAMSVEPGWDRAGPWNVASATVIGRDEPEHGRLRRQTNKGLSPKAVSTLMPTTRSLTEQVLDSRPGDTIDGWHDLALIVTHRTMCHLLQVPDGAASEVMHDMASTMPMLAARPREGTREEAAVGFGNLGSRIDALIDEKRKSPGDGLADVLLEAERNGEISEDERRATTLLLYSLGHMDVGYAIAAGLNIFAELPDVFDDYREKPELRDAIINEIIRYDPPELSFYRTVLESITIGGVDIPADSSVRFVLAAANRDPEAFDAPQMFDHHRSTTRSQILSFGYGTHGCIGQRLSRSQARTIYDTLADRYRRLELTAPVETSNTDFSRHFTKLPLRLVK